jgi:hypothetical protein
MQPLIEMVCNRFMQPLYPTLLSYPRQYATAYGNGRQPLYPTLLSYPRQYATAYGNGRQPLMEMADSRLWKWR